MLRAGHELDEADLAVFCGGRLADFELVKHLVRGRPAQDAAGKLLKTELRKTY